MAATHVLRKLEGSLISLSRQHSFVWMTMLWCVVSSAAAQEYKTDPVDNKSRVYSASAKQWLGNPAAYTADKAHFDDYFDKFYFPEMTRSDDVALGRLGDARFNLFKKFLWATNNAQLQQDLTAAALKKMKEIVLAKSPPYHPAVRYNAVLVLGMLDQQYAVDSGGGKRPPKPLPEANAFLCLIVNYAADDAPVPPPLVLGSLIGLERHAQFKDGLPPDAVAAMTAALLKLVTHEKPIQEMDPEAYAWIRLRAAGVLAKLGVVGDKNSVHDALVKLITSSKSLDDRCEVAGLLDKINYKDVKLDDATTAEPLFALARDVGAAEDKRAADFQNQFSSGGTTAPVRRPVTAEFSPGGGTTGEEETYPRRQVLARLVNLRAAVTKVKPALPAETQKKADELLKAILPATTAVASKDTVELKLAATIRAMAVAINKAVPAPVTEKAAPPTKAAAAL